MKIIRRNIVLAIIVVLIVTCGWKGVKALNSKSVVVSQQSDLSDRRKSRGSAIDDDDSIIELDRETVLIVNRENVLDENYLPENLTAPKTKFIGNGDPNVNKLEATAAKALEELFNAAKKDSIYLLGVSGYRDYNYQKNLYNKAVRESGKEYADKYTAKPGASGHQTGLVMDILSEDYQTLDDGFDKTDAYKWVEKNCSSYGFIIRYPKGKESITGYNYEPWHLRYVGKTVAKEIMGNGITLEEYVDIYN
ncbi:MAG: M15 family metallopeptidase [Clostridium sp.]|uniref:M15 family metallopeptidase n=1 Tax=Clostridium sp. TaxID=1506 RepID=UPI0030424CB1